LCRAKTLILSRKLRQIFLEINFVIRDSRHIETFNGLAVGALMRTAVSWNVGVCLQLEGSNYQPKQDRMLDPRQVI
jgi:hypothetical protein